MFCSLFLLLEGGGIFVEAIHKSAKGICRWVRNFEAYPFSVESLQRAKRIIFKIIFFNDFLIFLLWFFYDFIYDLFWSFF